METATLAVISGYRIERCSCPIPGYLIVSPDIFIAHLDDANEDRLRCLGPVLAKAMKAVRKVTGTEKLYCVQFGETGGTFHFHIFPRTAHVLAEFRRATASDRSDDGVPGPLVFHWARSSYRPNDMNEPEVAAQLIRGYLLE